MPRNPDARMVPEPVQPDEMAHYHVVVSQINDPASPDQYYWHLYYRNDKVNGGIADYRSDASLAADIAKFRDARSRWCDRYLWDAVEGRWRLKSEFSL